VALKVHRYLKSLGDIGTLVSELDIIDGDSRKALMRGWFGAACRIALAGSQSPFRAPLDSSVCALLRAIAYMLGLGLEPVCIEWQYWCHEKHDGGTHRWRKAFLFLPLIWSTGVGLGPLIGDFLSRPQDHFRRLLVGSFWGDYLFSAMTRS